MTVPRIPTPPPGLAKDYPEIFDFLMALTTDLQTKLNLLDDRAHQKGRGLRLYLVTKDNLLTTPFPIRAADYPLLVYSPDYHGDPFLGITDGVSIRAITIGPPIS